MYRFSTDDVMKGLEICGTFGADCNDCPFQAFGTITECTTYLTKGALELIKYKEETQWKKSTSTPNASTVTTTNVIDAYLTGASSLAELGLLTNRK